MPERPPADPVLTSLRQEIERIDRGIVLLLAARIDAAVEAIRYRSRSEGRVANPAQEARVLARARLWGEPFGLTEELTDTVFRMLIEAGKARCAAGVEGPARANVSPGNGGTQTRVVDRAPAAPKARVRLPAPA